MHPADRKVYAAVAAKIPSVKRHRRFVARAFVLVLTFGYASSVVAEPLGTEMSRVHQDPPPRAASIAVVRNGAVTFREDLGAANARSSYAIGSLTKMLTAVAVLQNAEAGRLRLDDAIARWFPDFPGAREITVRQLLTHRSGIPDHLPRAIRSGMLNTEITPEQIVARAATWAPDFAPGADWNYSNTGYLIAALIVQRVARMPYADYARLHIFAKAGMTHSAIGTTPAGTVLAVVPDGTVFGHGPGKTSPAWYFGCGDVVSTANDIATFDVALLGGALLSRQSLELMSAVTTQGTLDLELDDGTGAFVRHHDDRTTMGHHGGIPGYSADNQIGVAERSAVVVLQAGGRDADAFLDPAVREVLRTDRAPIVAADPDPSRTARIRNALSELLAGRIADGAFTPSLPRAALEAGGKVLAETFGGQILESVTYHAKYYDTGSRILVYAARAGRTTRSVLITLDPDGKISSFSLQ